MPVQLIENLEQIATDFVDNLIDLIAGSTTPLERAHPEREVVLPRDTYAHEEMQTEWWYYTGHLHADDRPFGFELVFFKRRTDLDRFGRIIPMRVLGRVNYYAHFAITDIVGRKFRYAHKRSINGSMKAGAAIDRHKVWLDNWSARELHSQHILSARMNSTSLNLALKPVKPIVRHGLNGLSYKDEGEASYYLSYTRMLAEGELVVDGKSYDVKGTGWMDHEFGSWKMKSKIEGWDWFALQLDNNQEVMAFQIRDVHGQPTRFSEAALIAEDGSVQRFHYSDFTLESTGQWRSPNTKALYPSGWLLKFPKIDAEFQITPLLKCQELDTRGSTMIIYWEGACSVKGSIAGQKVTGRSYVELVGYERSHENLTLLDFLVSEVRFRSLGLHLIG